MYPGIPPSRESSRKFLMDFLSGILLKFHSRSFPEFSSDFYMAVFNLPDILTKISSGITPGISSSTFRDAYIQSFRWEFLQESLTVML